MSGGLFQRPIWAGVVVKMADGVTYAFELSNSAGPMQAEITIEAETYDATDYFRDSFTTVLPTGRQHVHIEIDGWGTNSSRFAGMADDVRGQDEIPTDSKRALPS